MKVLSTSVRNTPTVVNVLEHEEDADYFMGQFRLSGGEISFDTEGTSLNPFGRNYRLRLAQIGWRNTAFVIPVEKGPFWANLVAGALRRAKKVYAHNLVYDALVADEHLKVPLEDLFPKSTDTMILSRIRDTRAAHEGGVGHSLENVVGHFLDDEVALRIKGSVREMAKELKTTKAKFWEVVPIDHDGYNLYAGLDAIFPMMLAPMILRDIPAKSKSLIGYEHQLAYVNAALTRKGFLMDKPYVIRMEAELSREQEKAEAKALTLGLENVNSTQQVAKALKKTGWVPETFTATGIAKVDAKVLKSLMAQGNPIAEAVYTAKRATKWNEAYFRTFLREADINDRIHAMINHMQARTKRYSITNPALQTLPSGDSMVRFAFLADPGEAIAGIDYSNQELRVIAVRSGDPVMLDAFRRNLDLHQMTADAASRLANFEIPRKAGKTANFAKVFGGGAKIVHEGANIPMDAAEMTVKAFNDTYRGVTAWNKKLMAQARTYGYIETWTGQRLYVDKSRAYSALNYDTQGGAREITAQAQLRLWKAGFLDFMRLPVHDEIIFSFPVELAESMAKEAGEIMSYTMGGPAGTLEISTEPDIYGASWGHGYIEPRRDWRSTL